MFLAYKKLLGRTEMLSVDTNGLRHLTRRSSKNCDMQFANYDRQTDRFKEKYKIV